MYIKWFNQISIRDIPLVGGKNASLGEMYQHLTKKGIKIPNGFAISAEAYRCFLKKNGLDKQIKELLKGLKVENVRQLAKVGKQIRSAILKAEIPEEIGEEIVVAYRALSQKSKVSPPHQNLVWGQESKKLKIHNSEFIIHNSGFAVAVRSSATAEDLPTASFAGQLESFLNVRGEEELLRAYQRCLASLFTDRAIAYRVHQGFDHLKVAISVGVQQMVRSDLASAGVLFTLDTDSGFREVVLINSSWGLGESVVKGRVNPDQFFVFKPTLKKGYAAIISHRLGSKETKLIYGKKVATQSMATAKQERNKFSLSDKEVLQLAKWGLLIEEYYGKPQDIEWAKDGLTGELFIVQSRPETVEARKQRNVLEEYVLEKKSRILCEGIAIGSKIGSGRAHLIRSPKQIEEFRAGEVLVTRMTDPDWEPIMRIAGAIVTEAGGKTSHAAIVSRELGVPCLVGTGNATSTIRNGQPVTVSCAEGEKGFVYEGILPFEVRKIELKNLGRPRVKIMMNLAEPDQAFNLSFLPNDGVGLAREEFIIASAIGIHPMALLGFSKLKSEIRNPKSEINSKLKTQNSKLRQIVKEIEERTVGYVDKKQFYIDKLAEGMAMIAAAFYPKEVIVRFSDFKTNEYASLIGGAAYEPEEENPMLGWRGASRYYDPKFKPAFLLECAALKKVREEMGLKNTVVMIPFCRTPEEGREVLSVMKEGGLVRGKDGLEVYVMAEIPTNILQAEEFARIFDGFSIGSNDLTQLTLGVDRDSALVSHIYDERNPAVKDLIRELIKVAHRFRRKVGICGQAPSDYPDFARFLVKEGIDSISLNPDTLVKTWRMLG